MFEAQRCIQCPAAPCIVACPIDNDIPGALAFLEIGKLADAAAVFRQTSEMPELCGRLCPQEALCEGSCVIGKNAKPVAIGKLEAFLGDWDREQRGGFPVPMPQVESGQRVANRRLWTGRVGGRGADARRRSRGNYFRGLALCRWRAAIRHSQLQDGQRHR